MKDNKIYDHQNINTKIILSSISVPNINSGSNDMVVNKTVVSAS